MSSLDLRVPPVVIVPELPDALASGDFDCVVIVAPPMEAFVSTTISAMPTLPTLPAPLSTRVEACLRWRAEASDPDSRLIALFDVNFAHGPIFIAKTGDHR